MGWWEGPLEELGLKSTYPHPSKDFWKGRRVWLSGHTGFKGAWLAFWLQELGAKVCGCSLPPPTHPSLFQKLGLGCLLEHQIMDIRDEDGVRQSMENFQPEVVFHLAAQALVRPGYENPVGTFGVNVQGTVHILDAMRHVRSVRAAVLVTTDKVYRDLEDGRPFREEDALGGRDPYSASKSAAEMAISCYRKSYFLAQGVGIAAARAGNVIGGGDWSKDRILPDAIRAWSKGGVLTVRNPHATRPWQHVLEPLAGYLRLGQFLFQNPSTAGEFNFGPAVGQNATVRAVVEAACEKFGSGKVVWGESQPGPYEASCLSLDPDRAAKELGVFPVWGLSQAVEQTMLWYRKDLEGCEAKQLCRDNLKNFLAGG
ncbi:CDP-glucose 4,6-dehydratase [bacterium]|nr:CDP-glucose 4,6-dehydratase [bacterium]